MGSAATLNENKSFKIGLIFVLFTIYALLAIPFRSYLQPLIVMSIIPFGLIPLIMEKNTQAQFLTPMAVSLGFGILFATFITLLLIPAFYLIF